MLTDLIKQSFIDLLEEELVPAMGCTEPIALALASAKARDLLGCAPTHIVAKCSGNIIKNVRCVTIPNSDGMVGIEAAVALGAFGGDASLQMEVISKVTAQARKDAAAFLHTKGCQVEYLTSDIPLHFIIKLCSDEDTVSVEIRYNHTNIVSITKNDTVIFQNDKISPNTCRPGCEYLSLDTIKAFADEVDLNLIQPIYDRQIEYNMNIALNGMSQSYGLGIGKFIQASYPDSTLTKMKAYTAAASEARMSGCDLPVIITSGSGNQGIASSAPVIIYAKENQIPTDLLYRALAFSSLLTIYQKEYIGKLSAFCGAVSASCASGAAISYLAGGTMEQIKNTIQNTLANIPGIICDGAKASCASKIATSLDAAMMGHYLAMSGKSYCSNSGILKADAEETIRCVGHIGKDGMKTTDYEIIQTMLYK